MAAARQLGAKMKKLHIPDVDPVSMLYLVEKYFTIINLLSSEAKIWCNNNKNDMFLRSAVKYGCVHVKNMVFCLRL